MKFEAYLRSSSSSLVSYWFWSVIYTISEKLLPSSKITQHIWGILKCDIFFIDGKCQQSGNCCKQLMLVKKGIDLDTKNKFEAALTKDKKFSRFIPNFDLSDNSKNKKIKNFSCTCLYDDNICMDYAGRPSFCRSYPFSIFIKDDKIPNTCGYFVNIKKNIPNFKFKSVEKKIEHIVKKNIGGI